MGRQPREYLVLHLLEANWDNSDTFGLTPDISFGWWNENKGQPQCLIQTPDEGPTDGGTTGYSAIDPGGGTPIQRIDGVITIHCWARSRDLGNASTDHAAQYLDGDTDGSNHGVTEEITDIIQTNASQPTDPTTGNQPVEVLAPRTVQQGPTQDDVGDRVVHRLVEVGYQFDR